MSIHKRVGKRGTTYRVMYREDGHQRGRTFDTRAEAAEFEHQLQRAIRRGISTAPLVDKLTLNQWLEEWFATHSSAWTKKTMQQRGSICEKWIKPLLGSTPIVAINKRVIRKYREQMRAKGATNNTINSAIAVLSASLTAAVDTDLIENNPCLGIHRLPHRKDLIRPLTPRQVEGIRSVMPTARDQIIVSLIAYAGMRPEEVCGLRWKNVRPSHIFVEEAAQLSEMVDTKTRKHRTVEILPALQADLDAYGRGSGDDLVVQGDRGGILNWNLWGQRVWRKYIQRESVKPYHLRHTFASLALHENRSVPWIAAQLGHNPKTLLDHYAHLYDESQLATTVPMDSAIRSARTAVDQQTRRRRARARQLAAAR